MSKASTILISVIINILILLWLSFFTYTQLYQDNSVINENAQNIYLNKWDILSSTELVNNQVELIAYDTQQIDNIILDKNITYVAVATIYENLLGRRNYATIINEDQLLNKQDNKTIITITDRDHTQLSYMNTICQKVPFMRQNYCSLLWKKIGYRITLSKVDKNMDFNIITE